MKANWLCVLRPISTPNSGVIATERQWALVRLCTYSNFMGDKLLLNFGTKFQCLYYNMRNFCNLIDLEKWYFSLTWNTYMWKL